MTNTTSAQHFTTYERDSESGNDYAKHRFYVSRLARFSSPDPVRGGAHGPQSLDLYSYVVNDPWNRADPTGRQSVGTLPLCPDDTLCIDCTLDDCPDCQDGENSSCVRQPVEGTGIGGGQEGGGGKPFPCNAYFIGRNITDQPCGTGATYVAQVEPQTTNGDPASQTINILYSSITFTTTGGVTRQSGAYRDNEQDLIDADVKIESGGSITFNIWYKCKSGAGPYEQNATVFIKCH
jgi:RHS repeat-associated protein